MTDMRQLSPTQANRLREEGLAFRNKHRDAEYKLACFLGRVKDQFVDASPVPIPIWKHWGFKSWNAYITQELQISAQTDRQYRQIWNVFEVQLKGKWDRQRVLPITKMSQIASSVDEKNVNQWLVRGASVSKHELGALVRHAKRTKSVQPPTSLPKRGTQTAEGSKLYELTLKLTQGELTDIETALLNLRKEFGDARKGSLLARLARFYLEMTQPSNTKRTRKRAA